jgi:hypothetical protein
MIPMFFVLVFMLSMYSGCIYTQRVPIVTLEVEIDPHNNAFASGEYSFFCDARSRKIAYDNESHENWEDYEYIDSAIDSTWYRNHFYIFLYHLPSKVKYYFRAVAYCFNFRGPLKDFKEGWYQGEEVSFTKYP